MAEIKTGKMNMKSFLRANLKAITEVETIEVSAPPSWPKDEDGNPVKLTVKPLTRDEFQKLYNQYAKTEAVRDEYGELVIRNGAPVQKEKFDHYSFIANGIANMLIDPDMYDKELWADLGVVEPVGAVKKLFRTNKDFDYMSKIFNQLHSVKVKNPEKTVEQLKN